jgi:hypothetical protein
MIGRRHLMPEILRGCCRQPRDSQHLFRSDDFVRAAREKIGRKPYAREVDGLTKRDKASGGKLVELV